MIHANFSLPDDETIFLHLDRLQQEVGGRLRLPADATPIQVYVFDRRKTYRRHLEQLFPGAPSRPALFVKKRGQSMVFLYVTDDLLTNLRHESTHAVLHGCLPFVPLWLDEGFAEYFEVPSGQQYGNNPHLRPVQRRVRWRRPPPLARLEQLDDVARMSAADYRDAWSWVHFLLHGPGFARQELYRYLAELRTHPMATPLNERMHRHVENAELERHFVRHFRSVRTEAG